MRKFTWKTCLFSCLGIIGLLVFVIILSAVWLTRKGEFNEGTTILTAETDMFTRVYLERDDEMLINFFVNQANKINSVTSQGFPAIFQNFQQSQTKRDIVKMLPVEAEISADPVAEHFSVAIGFSFYNNIAKLAFWVAKKAARDENMLHEHNDKPYIVVEDGVVVDDEVKKIDKPFFFTLASNTILLTNQESDMHAMLDSLSGPSAAHVEDARFRGVDVTAPVYGFAHGAEANRGLLGLFDDLEADSDLASGIDSSFLERIDRLAYDFRIEGQEVITGNLLFDTRDQSEEMKTSIEAAIGYFASNSEVEINHTIEETEAGYLVRLQMTGFAEAVTDNINQ